MNRSTLNGSVMGSGNSLPWITAAATQVLRIVGTMSVSLRKYGSANQSMSLSGHLRILRYVYEQLSVTLSLIGSMPARAWVRVYGAVNDFIKLVGTAFGRINVIGYGNGSLKIDATAVPRQLTAVHADGGTTLAIDGAATGNDLYTGPASEARTTGVVLIKTQTTATVEIGGQ
jgi:hypothetical protein